ncbi:MAG: hypothetical protein ACI8QT_000377 [Halioglobus sp.]|jgi:hypothetical protein
MIGSGVVGGRLDLNAMLAVQDISARTVGLMQVFPNSCNTIPGKISMVLDLRHPEDDVLIQMDAGHDAWYVADSALASMIFTPV